LTVSKSLAKPYARALFELAADKIERGLWLHRLQVLDKVFQDPVIREVATKAHSNNAIAWLKEVLGDGLDKPSYALLALLLENRRLSSLADIRLQFADLMVELHGFGVLRVTSAVPLSDEERTKSLALFEGLFQQKLIPHYRVDPLIRGGIMGQVKDLVYDGSVKGSLEKLRGYLIQ